MYLRNKTVKLMNGSAIKVMSSINLPLFFNRLMLNYCHILNRLQLATITDGHINHIK